MTDELDDPFYPAELRTPPQSWARGVVQDFVADVRPGFASGIHNQDGEGVPHLRPMNVSRNGNIDLSVVKFVGASNPLRIAKNDVLFNNTNSAELVGKTACYKLEMDAAFSNHMTRLRPLDGVDSSFLALQLHYLWSRGYFQRRCVNHVNQASVSSKVLAETVPLVMPPLAEQARIVAAIETQFSRLDAATAALERSRANLKRYRAAVLNAACSGRLVSTQAEFSEIPLADGIPTRRDNLPSGWQRTTLAEVSINLDGRRIPVKAADRATRPGPYPYYGASGIIDRVDNFLFSGDHLLVAEDGANLLSRSTPIAFIASGRFWVNNHAHVLLPKDGVLLKYLAFFLNATDLQFFITGSAQPKLTQAALNRIPILLPPLDEQERIVAEVERRLSVVERMEAEIAAGLARAERLRQAILQRAFTGQLVPQDPNDESAGALLDRIRAEREATFKRPPAARRKAR